MFFVFLFSLSLCIVSDQHRDVPGQLAHGEVTESSPQFAKVNDRNTAVELGVSSKSGIYSMLISFILIKIASCHHTISITGKYNNIIVNI